MKKNEYAYTLSISKAADFLGMKPWQLRHLSNKGVIKTLKKNNGHRLFSVHDLKEYRMTGAIIDQIQSLQYFVHHSLDETEEFIEQELARIRFITYVLGLMGITHMFVLVRIAWLSLR